MKKWVLLGVLLFLGQVSVRADSDLSDYINYTGHGAMFFADYPILFGSPVNTQGKGFLGGNGNDYASVFGAQFTVSDPLIVKYLTIDAAQVPFPYDPSLPGYNDPQSMDVTFSLIEGTRLSGPGPEPIPGTLTLASQSLVFSTENGQDTEYFNDLKIPFQADLTPDNTYWLVGTSQYEGPRYISYSTELSGTVVTPEPPTVALFGLGLIPMFLKAMKRFRFKPA